MTHFFCSFNALFQVNVRLIAELRAADLLFTSKASVGSVGRTSVFNLLYLLPMTATTIGNGIVLAGHDQKRVFVDDLYYPFVITGQFFFVCATLSVCSVWNSTAKRVITLAADGRHMQQPSTSPEKIMRTASNGSHTGARANVWGIRHWMQFLKLIAGMEAPVAASLSALTIATMVSYFSPLYVSIAMSVCCLVVSVSFAAAGSRMARLLSISADAISLRQEEAKQLGQQRPGMVRRNSLGSHPDDARNNKRMPPRPMGPSNLTQLPENILLSDLKHGEQGMTESISHAAPTSQRSSSGSEEAQSEDEAASTDEGGSSSSTCCDDHADVEAGKATKAFEASDTSKEREVSEGVDRGPSHDVHDSSNAQSASSFCDLWPSSNRRTTMPRHRVKTSLSMVADEIHSTAHFIIR